MRRSASAFARAPRWAAAALVMLAVVSATGGCRGRGKKPAGIARVDGGPVYDDRVDAEAEIADAVAQAKAEHRRVLLVFGASWCPWCRKLDASFREEPTIAERLAEAFVVVHVSTGDRGADVNRAILARYVPGSGMSLPFLVVLDEEGKVVVRQATDALEDGDHHDPARVLAFLDRVRGP
jgi:thiol:disulfide interchange protein